METNIWKRFVGLLPGGSKTIGLVTFVNSVQGTTTVTLRNGNTFIAKGLGVDVGKNALVIDDRLIGEVPTLPQYDVLV